MNLGEMRDELQAFLGPAFHTHVMGVGDATVLQGEEAARLAARHVCGCCLLVGVSSERGRRWRLIWLVVYHECGGAGDIALVLLYRAEDVASGALHLYEGSQTRLKTGVRGRHTHTQTDGQKR